MRSKFKLTRVTAAVVLATTGMATMQSSMAGPGFADIVLQDGTAARKATFFAYSPSGQRVTPVPEAADLAKYPTGNFTGKALRKFVDPLPLPGAANAKMMADGTTSKYLPVAVASKWVKPDGSTSNDDYYEIAVIEFTDKFHSDLKKPTTLRGYVQIDHNASNGRAALPGSQSFALTYPDGTAIMIAGTDANGKLTGGKVQALAVEKPRFLGPVIAATKGTPTRLKFLNLLPTGRAELGTPDAAGKPVIMQRHGDIFLPVDKSIMGAGVGPDGQTEFTQNRADIHLHGGDTPWISDGTPHQWITPGDEADAAHPRSLAKAFNDAANALDPTLLPNYLRGASAANVPDMYDPGAGAMTYYFPNGQSARMLWYHDHTVGATRLNVYAGMASGYLLTDAKEQELINTGILPPAARTIPLVLQDRTFVPDDIALQDGRWNTSAWGQPGDSWFPHVYETVQDPEQQNNWNAVGRWHYGPWFWPVFPALYSLPTGEYSLAGAENTVTTTPEAWMDTPIVNGVAYPVLEVDPTTYRFRILNASNDRMMTFNLFEGKSTATLADGTPVTATHPWLDANGNPVVYPDGTPATFPVKTEIDMMPAAAPLPADACAPGQTRPSLIGTSTTKYCTPDTWPTDNRLGGVPTPASVGPALHQIANESGWLAKVNTIEPTPIAYIQDKGRITVLNPDTMALFLGPAERADVVVDFSQYAGKTLIVYNDSGAPVPAGDPRNDLFTGVGDQAGSGGAEDTKPGYGPNTRTMMQIRVKPLAANQQPAAPLNLAALESGISNAYFATQERPVVAQPDYAGFDPAWASLSPTQSYANIYTGSLKQPTFEFTPGTPLEGINSVKVLTGGSGYIQAPTVTISAPVTAAGVPVAGGKTATALATMKIDAITVTNPGTGYTMAPVMTIIGGGGNGATASATLANFVPTVTAGGTGYTGVPSVSFTAPPAGGVRATGQAVVTNGVVTGITMTNAGSGYLSAPLVSITGGGGTGAKATTKGGIGAVKVVAPDPAIPSTAGGGGYTDMAAVQINFVGGNGTGAAASATGKVFDITLTHPGFGYVNTAVPSVTLSAAPVGGTTATAQSDMAAANASAKGSILVKTKTIQELFDPTYGRLNATLGVELPFTSALTQTTIPLGYVDEPTEQFADGETQIWKITHNGVDTHPVHFHLLNVQLINRVGWDGFITPPLPQEIGWKETVKMHPLEDVIVAVRAKKPTLDGFGLPLSRRLMDPTQPQGSPFGFTQIDPTTGNPKTVVNDIINYGWEYVWHCHILGHEENDFMRPVIFNANEGIPTAPIPASATYNATTGVQLVWTDTSASEYQFEVFRAEVLADGVTIGAFTPLATSLANATSYTDASAVNFGGTALAYKVVAVGAAGRAESTTIIAPVQLAAPLTPTAFAAAANSGTQVTLNWGKDPASALAAGLLLERSLDAGATWTGVTPATAVNGSNPVVFTNLPATATSYVDTTLTKDTTVQYRLSAANLTGASALTQATVDTLGAPAVTALSNVIDVAAATPKVTLSWTVAAPVRAQVISRFDVVRTTGAGVSTTFTVNDPAALGYVDSTVQQNVTYTYVVNAVNANGITPVTGASMSTQAVMPFGAAGPLTTFTSAATAAGTLPTRVTLNWAAATPATQYVLTRLCTATTSTTPCAVGPVTVGTYASMPVGGVIDSTVAPLSSYTYTLTAINGDNPAQSTATTSVTTPAGVIAPTNLGAVVSFANGTATLTWTDQATNETSFLVQRSSDGGLTYASLGNVAPRTGTVGQTRTFTDNAAGGFVAGSTYLYRVIAQNVTAGVTNDSAPSNVVTVNYFLGAPTGLTAAATGPSSITLNWVDGSTAEASFAVWRSTDGGVTWGAAPIATVARTAALGLATGGAVTYVDTNTAAKPVVSGVTYTYRVTAVNGPAASAPSNTIDASIAVPATPTGLTAAITAANRVTLTWVDASTTETGFAVWRSDGVNNVQVGTVTRTAAQAAATAGLLTFQHNGVAPNGFVPGTTYAYTVTATNGTGATSASAPTAPVNVGWLVPTTPDTVSAVISSTTRVTISWNDASTTETSFTVLRGVNGGAPVAIGTVNRSAAQGLATGGALLTFANNNSAATPLVLGNTYNYSVRANNLVGGSPASSPVVDVPFVAPAAPAAVTLGTLTLTSGTRATVVVNLPAAVPGATGYTLQRQSTAGSNAGWTTLTIPAGATTVTETNVRRSATPYVYQIRANGAAGNSVYTQSSITVN